MFVVRIIEKGTIEQSILKERNEDLWEKSRLGGGGGVDIDRGKTRYQDAISTLKEEEEKTQKLSYPKRLGQDTTKAPPPLKGEHMLSDLTQHHTALYGDQDAFEYRCLFKGGEKCDFPSSE